MIKARVAFLKGRLFSSQSGLFENFLDYSDWRDKSRPSKKSHFCFVRVNRLMITLIGAGFLSRLFPPEANMGRWGDFYIFFFKNTHFWAYFRLNFCLKRVFNDYKKCADMPPRPVPRPRAPTSPLLRHCLNLFKFAQISPRFCPNLIKLRLHIQLLRHCCTVQYRIKTKSFTLHQYCCASALDIFWNSVILSFIRHSRLPTFSHDSRLYTLQLIYVLTQANVLRFNT